MGDGKMEYDRVSSITIFILNQKQEEGNKINFIYSILPTVRFLDEDLIINENGKEILLPKGKAEIAAIILPIENNVNLDILKVEQPSLIIAYKKSQYIVNIRYLYGSGELIDFGSGIEDCIYVFPTIIKEPTVQVDQLGMAMYLPKKVMRSMFAQIYLLNDPFNKFPNLKLVHSEPNLIIDNLNKQGLDLPEFVFFLDNNNLDISNILGSEDFYGPIKIWEIEYIGNEEIKEEYLDIDASKYLNWTL